jgi:hypothetical protein
MKFPSNSDFGYFQKLQNRVALPNRVPCMGAVSGPLRFQSSRVRYLTVPDLSGLNYILYKATLQKIAEYFCSKTQSEI